MHGIAFFNLCGMYYELWEETIEEVSSYLSVSEYTYARSQQSYIANEMKGIYDSAMSFKQKILEAHARKI